LPISVPDGFPVLLVDAIEPVPGANGLLLHDQPSVSPAWTGVSYHGNYSAGGFGMVFSSLPFESISSSDPQPNNQTEFLRRIVQFLNADITPGVRITPPAVPVTTEAGGASSFAIVLTSQPSHPVTIPLASSATSEGSLSVGSVSFSSDNWNIPQTIVVTGSDDPVDDGDSSWHVLTGPAVSIDPFYSGLNPEDPAFINRDDDTAEIRFSALSGLTTSEAAASVSFTVWLATQPLAPVTISLNSSDATEGSLSHSSLVFTATSWNQPQTVVVTGVDDSNWDGNVTYSIIISSTVSADPLYHGIDPADFTLVNLDNDPPPHTKFYAVDDAAVDSTFEYEADGTPIENYGIHTENTAPRGIAMTTAGDRLWVVDSSRTVFVYDTSGLLLGSWTANLVYSNSDVQGIATDGVNIWIVERLSDRVYYFPNAASRLSGTQTASSSWFLNFRNADATDMVFGSQNGQRFLWVVNDSSADRVFRYTLNASGGTSGFTSWPLHSSNSRPTGIALDPANGSMDIWVADAGTSRVYRYSDARTASAPALAGSFALAAANTNVQGIADPPPPAAESGLDGYEPVSAAESPALSHAVAHPSHQGPTVRNTEARAAAATAPEMVARKVLNLKQTPNRSPATVRQIPAENSPDFVRSKVPPRNSTLDLFAEQNELDLLFATL
ncbi:MAG: hypothetical protein ACKOEO_20390, partial [Planctomycetaceae bacterium]